MRSPRDSHLGVMWCSHRRYNLGDPDGGDAFRFGFDDCTSWTEVREGIERAYPGVVVLPLYLYDHSGITMNTEGFSCPWDSGQVGHIYALPDAIRKRYGVKRITAKVREHVADVLRSEVETYDRYLMGE